MVSPLQKMEFALALPQDPSAGMAPVGVYTKALPEWPSVLCSSCSQLPAFHWAHGVGRTQEGTVSSLLFILCVDMAVPICSRFLLSPQGVLLGRGWLVGGAARAGVPLMTASEHGLFEQLGTMLAVKGHGCTRQLTEDETRGLSPPAPAEFVLQCLLPVAG